MINTENIKKLIASDVSAYQIEKETGVSRMTITNYRNNKSNLMNMSLENGRKLSNYWEEINMTYKISATEFKQAAEEYKGSFLVVFEDGLVDFYPSNATATGDYVMVVEDDDFVEMDEKEIYKFLWGNFKTTEYDIPIEVEVLK